MRAKRARSINLDLGTAENRPAEDVFRQLTAGLPTEADRLAMCGRYVSFLPPAEIARLFRTVNPLPNIAPNWNLAPSQDALVVR